jgi:hypothetical protein
MNTVGNNQTSGLTNLGEVVVEEVPARLAAVTRAILISGMIAEKLEGGALLLKTQVGEITIRSPIPLPEGKLLTLQIPPGAPPVRAEVFVSKTAVPTGPTTTVLPSLPLPSTTTTSNVAKPLLPPPSQPIVAAPLSSLGFVPEAPPLLPGTVLTAQVQAMPEAWPNPSNPLPAATPNPQLETLLAQIKTIPQPVASLKVDALAELLRQLPANVFIAEPAIAPPAQSAPASAPAAPVPISAPTLLSLPPGAKVTLLIEAIYTPPSATSLASPASLPVWPTPPSANSPTAAPPFAASLNMPAYSAFPSSMNTVMVGSTLPDGSANAKGPIFANSEKGMARNPFTFPATPMGNLPSGETLLTSPVGLLVLPERMTLDSKTILTVSILGVEEPPIDANTTPLAIKHWPVLQELLALAPQVTPTRIPKPGPTMSPLLVLFMSALKLNDIKGWLGEENSRAVRETAGGETLLTRLSAEFQQARTPDNTAPDTWKTLALPVPPDGHLRQLVLHNRQEADPAAPGEFGQRLLVEVELSRLGPMQLDGFIRAKRFDLTLRSQRSLTPEIREGARQVFVAALDAVAYHGGLKFETAADLWLMRQR